MRTKFFPALRNLAVTATFAYLISGELGVGMQAVAIVIALTAFREPAAAWLRACYAEPEKIAPQSDEGRSATAFHEAGHAVVGWVLTGANKPRRATIVPNAEDNGSVDFHERRDPYDLLSALDELAAWFAGSAAQQEFGRAHDSGASEDIERATELATRMVCEWGFSGKLQKRRYDLDSGTLTEETLAIINAEIDRFLEEGEKLAVKTVKAHRDRIGCVAALLMRDETLDEKTLRAAIESAAA